MQEVNVRPWHSLILPLLALAIQFAAPAIVAGHAHDAHADEHERQRAPHDDSTCHVLQLAGNLRNLDTAIALTAVHTDLAACGETIVVVQTPHPVAVYSVAQPRGPPAL